MYTKAYPEVCQQVEQATVRLNGEYRVSRNGTPYGLMDCGPYKACLYFFPSTDTWKVFWPYASQIINQNRLAFTSSEAAENYIAELRVRTDQTPQNPITEASRQIRAKVENLAKAVKGTFRISRRGVPHGVVERDGIQYSFCYFAGPKHWKIFWPYGPPYGDQQSVILKTGTKVQAWLDGREEELYQFIYEVSIVARGADLEDARKKAMELVPAEVNMEDVGLAVRAVWETPE